MGRIRKIGSAYCNYSQILYQFLTFTQNLKRSQQRIPMYMSDWENRLNAFLQFTGRKVLDNNGHISREDADRFAKEQYEIFDYHRKALESHSEELDILPVLPEEHK